MAFLVAIDVSTDITDISQLAIFVCGIDATLRVTEEFVQLVPKTEMTNLKTSSVHLLVHLTMLG